MTVAMTNIGSLKISRLILGGNPFSGNSHQGEARDREMIRYFTTARIKAIFREAEELGINTFLGRADKHIVRVLAEYWDEGGKIQWIAQTCPEFGSPLAGANAAIRGGAHAVYIHGGQMDFLLAQNRLEEAAAAIECIQAAGLPAGIASHTPAPQIWANQNLALDFHMCSYYNPSPREKHAEHRAALVEVYDPDDRDRMVGIIPTLKATAIHYKIFAAGRNNPEESFAFVRDHLRAQDAVCVGIYPKDKPDMLAENVRLFTESLKEEA
jgi:hypothetical protein